MTRRVSGSWLISSSGAQAVNAAAGMLTNVIYARSLSLADVGLIALVNAVGMFSTVFLDRGMGAWMTRALAAREVTFRNTLSIVVRAARPGLTTMVLVGVGLAFFAPMLPAGTVLVSTYSIFFVLSFWIFQVGLSFTQGLDLPGLRSIGTVLNGFLTLAGTFLVLSFGGGIAGALVATIVAYFAVGLALIGISAKTKRAPVNSYRRTNSKRAIRSARPLFGSNIVTYAISSGDVLVASLFFSTSQVGQYQIAKKVAQAAVLPLIATLPMVLGKISARDERQRRHFILKFVRASTIGFSLTLFLGSGLLPFAIPILFGQSYRDTVGLTLVLMTAYQFQFLRDLLSTYANSRQLYSRSLVANIATVCFFLIVALSLNRTVDLTLFATVTLAAFLIGFSLHLFFMLRNDKWETQNLLKLAVLSISLIAILGVVQVIPQLLTSWHLI